MAMAASARSDESVLKLVHPGGYVEIHRSPVLASNIMEENPRHFVTRPDVFKFPWIVVRPESVLMPGKVFYIVPCRTLYRLVRDGRPLVSARSAPQRAGTMASVGIFDERSKTAGAKSCLKKQSCGESKDSHGRRVVFALPADRVAV